MVRPHGEGLILDQLRYAQEVRAFDDVPMDEVGYYRIRPPLKPITLGELAAIDIEGHAEGEKSLV